MNWLGHAALSPERAEVRLANVLANFMRPGDLEADSPLWEGVRLHQRIDRYTDDHPVTRRSRGRISEPLRRAAGVLVDLFYDHFLTVHWGRYWSESLPDFLSRLERDARPLEKTLPPKAAQFWQDIKSDRLMARYGDIDSIAEVVARLRRRMEGSRFSRLPLERAVDDLRAGYDGFERDFLEFYPSILAMSTRGASDQLSSKE